MRYPAPKYLFMSNVAHFQMYMQDIFACADRIRAVCDGKVECSAYIEQLNNITSLLGNEPEA
jgi:hypothetical protein